ncbi:hypothetical protein Gotri_005335, partial [Gossypium trilobum]|nr:hypothetical protein [Gossypium trilobum]
NFRVFFEAIKWDEGWESKSWRWGGGDSKYNNVGGNSCGGFETSLTQMEGLNMYGNGVDNGLVLRKRAHILSMQ